MISEKLKIKILLIWNKYNEISQIPKIKKVLPSFKSNSWAFFSNEDLYNQNYKLYINEKIENQPDELIEFVLFHEFTHMADSINFLTYSFDDFQKLMTIYSEVHASEILMDRLLSTQIQKPYSLEQYIIFNIKITLKSFMEQTLSDLEDEFVFKNELKLPFNFNRKKFYYFVGYIVSLRKNNVPYDFYFKNLDKTLSEIFYEIILIFTETKYDYELLIEYDDLLHKTILNNIKRYMGLPDKRS